MTHRSSQKIKYHMQNAQKQRGGGSGKLIAVRLLQHSGTGPPDRVQLIVQHTHTTWWWLHAPHMLCSREGIPLQRRQLHLQSRVSSTCKMYNDNIKLVPPVERFHRGRRGVSRAAVFFFAYQTRCGLDGRNVATSSRQRYHTPRHLAAAGSCQFSTPRQRLI